jgi:hypothetical protein
MLVIGSECLLPRSHRAAVGCCCTLVKHHINSAEVVDHGRRRLEGGGSERRPTVVGNERVNVALLRAILTRGCSAGATVYRVRTDGRWWDPPLHLSDAVSVPLSGTFGHQLWMIRWYKYTLISGDRYSVSGSEASYRTFEVKDELWKCHIRQLHLVEGNGARPESLLILCGLQIVSTVCCVLCTHTQCSTHART